MFISGRPIEIFTYINYNYISKTQNYNLGLNLKSTDTPKIVETPIIPETPKPMTSFFTFEIGFCDAKSDNVEHPNQSQPNPGSRPNESPCTSLPESHNFGPKVLVLAEIKKQHFRWKFPITIDPNFGRNFRWFRRPFGYRSPTSVHCYKTKSLR